MSMATLTSKGQTTIPKEIRDRLGLRPGDRIEFIPMSDGSVRLMARNLPIGALKGMLPRPKRAVSVKAMNEAIAEAAAARRRRK
ncbi:MAG: AbrB/MazE/SpoVT family DNA-binding domain-containing protein [Dongiaceae bacterium]